ncbi:flagellar biosynthesis protein FlhB [Geochorda subterranea]|uniref:Flagellar biosynthetic protein FlhB n=1 Tax=Geochorda subterranea TaxID=3109564 RepID=A0ABZ1BKD6_9FIRM|nr:flagellar biosynthesis protein FlhB [Limnochorda sp. LNt]WRP13322.1 flagellar biosynthesis protein FlhB [Limnochorda sp. LNt]
MGAAHDAGPGAPLSGGMAVESPLDFDLQRFADGERTEAPTPRRRQEARRRGQVARSMDLSMAVVALAGALAAKGVAGLLTADARSLATELWGGLLWQQELTVDRVRQMGYLGLTAMRGLVPLTGAVMLAGLASQVLQVGFVASGTPLTPTLSRIDPIAHLKRLFSARALVELVKATAKAVVVAWAGWSFIRTIMQASSDLLAMGIADATAFVADLAYQQLLRMGLVLLVIGGLDYAYQRWEYEQSLKMSRHELLDELKQTEGDPHVRGRIRSRMRQLLSQRMMQRVPRASVVVTNPTHVAVALEYEEARMEAPVVVAKGQEWLARRIAEVARQHGVPVVENPPLAWALFEGVPVGQAIPPRLYRAVAEVLAYVYRLRQLGPRAAGRPVWRAPVEEA